MKQGIFLRYFQVSSISFFGQLVFRYPRITQNPELLTRTVTVHVVASVHKMLRVLLFLPVILLLHQNFPQYISIAQCVSGCNHSKSTKMEKFATKFNKFHINCHKCMQSQNFKKDLILKFKKNVSFLR